MFCSSLLIAGVATILDLLFSLSLLDLLETLLGFDSLVCIVVLCHEGVPPLLLFCSHAATVSCFAKIIDLTEDRSSLFFKLFQFAHNIIGF